MNLSLARAHANLALVKYWGKSDEDLILPRSPSLSLTIDALSTTCVAEGSTTGEDAVFIDGEKTESERVLNYLRFLKAELGLESGVIVRSVNHFPQAAGLASSASSCAAMAGALVGLSVKNLSLPAISRLARHGSGSACRSVYGGFAAWVEGDDQTSVAQPLESPLLEDISVVICLVSREFKSIPSRLGMRMAQSSPLYEDFIYQCHRDFKEACTALRLGDLSTLGDITERNTLAMNRVNQTARPPLIYPREKTEMICELAKQLREEGITCWYTNDAGANAFLITQEQFAPLIAQRVHSRFDVETIIAGPGPGLEVRHA